MKRPWIIVLLVSGTVFVALTCFAWALYFFYVGHAVHAPR